MRPCPGWAAGWAASSSTAPTRKAPRRRNTDRDGWPGPPPRHQTLIPKIAACTANRVVHAFVPRRRAIFQIILSCAAFSLAKSAGSAVCASSFLAGCVRRLVAPCPNKNPAGGAPRRGLYWPFREQSPAQRLSWRALPNSGAGRNTRPSSACRRWLALARYTSTCDFTADTLRVRCQGQRAGGDHCSGAACAGRPAVGAVALHNNAFEKMTKALSLSERREPETSVRVLIARRMEPERSGSSSQRPPGLSSRVAFCYTPALSLTCRHRWSKADLARRP